jgi:hypothetical protein
MKYFLITGGFWGFLLVLGASLYAGKSPAFALLDASIGCIVGSILLRLFYSVVQAGRRGVLEDQRRMEAAERLTIQAEEDLGGGGKGG